MTRVTMKYNNNNDDDEYGLLFHSNAPYPFVDAPTVFVGREQEMKRLDLWLEDENVPLTAVVSPSGTGKSSLLWQWQKHICIKSPAPAVEEVIWWDATQPNAGILHFLHAALIFVGDDPHIYRDARHQLERLLEQFLYRPFLLIIDGVERWLYAYERLDSIYNSEPAIEGHADALSCVHPLAAELLRRLAAEGATKTAVSTEILPRELDNTLPQELQPLTKEEAHCLFRETAVSTPFADVEEVGKPIAYHPLTLRVLAGYAAADPTILPLAQIVQFPPDSSQQQKQEAMLAMAVRALPMEALKLLSSLAALPAFVSEKMMRDLYNGRCHLRAIAKKTKSWSSRLFGGKTEDRNYLMETAVLLQQRGLLYPIARYGENNKRTDWYGMHDIVRRAAIRELADSNNFHHWMNDYYREQAKEKREKGESVLPTLRNAYYHIISADAYDEAYEFYQTEILPVVHNLPLPYRQEKIEMLQLLFPNGELSGTHLKTGQAKVGALHELADLYADSGRFIRAMYLYKQSVMMLRKQKDKGLLVESLNALVHNQLQMGGLKVAARNGRRALDLHEQIPIRYKRIPAHWNYGRVLTYQGEWARARVEFGTAMGLAKAENAIYDQCITWCYLAQFSLLKGDVDDGYAAAEKANNIALSRKDSKLQIMASWLLGWASSERKAFTTAERLLDNALYHSRAADLIAYEPMILLAQARLHHAQGNGIDRSWKLTKTAVTIATRYDCKLDLAESMLFLTQLALERGKYAQAHELIKKTHLYARCDGEAYVYKTVLTEANRVLKMLSYSL